MSIFEDVKIKWKSSKDGSDKVEQFTIPSDKVMRAIAAIEEHVTLVELGAAMQTRGSIPLVKLSRAYAEVLRIAGKPITDEEVYESMFVGTMGSNNIMPIVNGLLMMMIPPSTVKTDVSKVEDTSQGNERPAAAN